ncbi:MAG: 3-hydroxybutyryl-CoA dehydrogenase [Dethiobacteria bacterium]
MLKILVVGAGTMGAGIAQVAAQAGYEVFLQDITEQYVNKGKKNIASSLERMAKKGKLEPAQIAEITGRIQGIVDLEQAKEADFVIEAALENLEVKEKIFRNLDQIVKPEAILASNTSSLSITALGAATKRPEKVIGMHFFNPPPIMKLVEVVKGVRTAPETIAAVKQVAEKMNKKPIVVNESPGFVVNRILVPMINEAAYLLMEGVATKEEIDEGMKYGASHPIGPLALADLIGLDVCLAVMEILHEEFGEDKYRPCPLLRKMVRAGLLGRKTNKGFYSYE